MSGNNAVSVVIKSITVGLNYYSRHQCMNLQGLKSLWKAI